MSRGAYVYEYPRPSVTADVVVVTRKEPQRILLIRRANEPYQGCWALPGGFIEMHETLEESARRELLEETGVVAKKMYELGAWGDPDRDPRGRTITIAYLTIVSGVEPQAADDAAEARWFPLQRPPKMAFDHAKIIAAARRRLKTMAE